jgi:acyl CoA:acetate/3-ketoacid CoA transferase beta subunit
MSTGDFTLDELCVVACAEAWRGDGEILASPMGTIPLLGARLARATFAPDLLLSDGVASLIGGTVPLGGTSKEIEGWVPYRTIFDIVWSGRRHVMMGASQIDRFGNQNIACIGEFARPKSQLLGVRGAPGNTINHPTSYWVPNHTARVFVPKVDFVSGVGYDRAAALGAGARFHEIRRVISNKGVFDFETPDHSMRLRSVHPGVSVDEIVANTGFPLVIPPDLASTRPPTSEELQLIRDVLDPKGVRKQELRS